MGKGEVKIKLNGSVWELRNVIHVFHPTKNLIFVGQLSNDDCTIVFHKYDWRISKGVITIDRGKKSDTLKTGRA